MSGSPKLEDIYRAHHPWLSNWLQKRLGCHAQAADLAQDTFVKLITKPKKFPNLQEAKAFVTTIAKGLCIDHWRRKQIEQAWLENLKLAEEYRHIDEVAQRAIIDTLIILDEWLAKLPDDVTRAFIASQVQGFTYAEIADQLQLSERTIKRYIAQALVHCAQLIDD
ncbi:sigma-70 family RNA polymerase sigma factor [Rhodanobacter aciditrophus]|uniref:Sigma-70 family RNA polymerase sigma factor n=1 Tax=Rhodanobacter aciditrophus TaxID=1623218 RepID=A0ABW4B2M7_9GAMM